MLKQGREGVGVWYGISVLNFIWKNADTREWSGGEENLGSGA